MSSLSATCRLVARFTPERSAKEPESGELRFLGNNQSSEGNHYRLRLGCQSRYHTRFQTVPTNNFKPWPKVATVSPALLSTATCNLIGTRNSCSLQCSHNASQVGPPKQYWLSCVRELV